MRNASEMSNVLLTGGTGFIGKSLSSELRKDYMVYTPKRSQLDISDKKELRKYIEANSIYTIIHCAVDYKKDISLNIQSMQEALISCKSYYNKLIYMGSGAEYSIYRNLYNVKEEEVGEHVPTDEYGLAKYLAYKSTSYLDNAICLRLFGVTGNGDNIYKRFIPNTIAKSILGMPVRINNNRVMSYVDVRDIAEVTKILINRDCDHNAYNIVSEDIELSSLAKQIIQRTNSRSTLSYKLYEQGFAYTGSNKRIKEEIDYKFRRIDKIIGTLITSLRATNLGDVEEKLRLNEYNNKFT